MVVTDILWVAELTNPSEIKRPRKLDNNNLNDDDKGINNSDSSPTYDLDTTDWKLPSWKEFMSWVSTRCHIDQIAISISCCAMFLS
jgi:hypothetical protein